MHEVLLLQEKILYLNNSGSRWITTTPEYLKVRDEAGNLHRRKVLFYESFGNFAAAYFSWKGKKISRLPDDTDSDGELIVNL